MNLVRLSLSMISLLSCTAKNTDSATTITAAPTTEPEATPAPEFRRTSFIAVHCDPGSSFPEELENLITMIDAATEAQIPLTLMFTPQWVEPLIAAGGRSLVEDWQDQGHELSTHHHSVNHPGTWDGYTDFDSTDTQAMLGEQKWSRAQLNYGVTEADWRLGTLDEWQLQLQRILPPAEHVTGCANAERDKRSLPGWINIDTCPGFTTNDAYAVGTRSDGDDPLSGANDFALVGENEDGSSTQFLGHAMISEAFIDETWTTFQEHDAVFGVVLHTKAADVRQLQEWLSKLDTARDSTDFLTVRATVERLPQEHLDTTDYQRVYPE